MAQYEYLKKDEKPILVDAAIRDRNGKIIDTQYTHQELVDGEGSKALIFNEVDGGGAMFQKSNGVTSFVGVHNADSSFPFNAQVYAIDSNNSGQGTKIDVSTSGAFYTNGEKSVLPASQRDVTENEIAVKGFVAESVEAEQTRAQAEEAKKVDKSIVGTSGTASIFNEADGGGAMFQKSTGVTSFVGVHDASGDFPFNAQAYAIDAKDSNKGSKIDISTSGVFYTNGDDSILPAVQRDVEANEIAVKGDVADAVANKQNLLLGDATHGIEGQPFNIPYYFHTSADATKVTVHADTLKLDNKTTEEDPQHYQTFSMDVPSATTSVAGLMSAQDKQDLANKIDATQAGTIADNKINATIATLDSTLNIPSGKIITKIVENNGILSNAETADIEMDDVSGLSDKFTEVKNRIDGITVTKNTSGTNTEYSLMKDGAVAGEKIVVPAGVDVSGKVDKPNEPVAGQGVNVPYYFAVTYGADKATVTDYTVDLLDKTKDFGEYHLDINKATTTTAGLMTATDKAKLDGLKNSEYSIKKTELSTNNYKYELTKDGVVVSGADAIIVDNNKLLKSSTVKVCTEAGVPLEELAVGDKYIDLEWDTDPVTHSYISLKGIGATYTAGDGIAISSANAISTTNRTVETITSETGTAKVWNEVSGGGAGYIHTDGSEAFVGVNNDGKSGMMAQIYADVYDNDLGKYVGSRINVYHDKIYYQSKVKTQGSVAKNDPSLEIATVGAVDDAITPIETALAGKQATLVSGTNIKTINNESILGSGDLAISVPVTDVTVDGTSIVEGKVAKLATAGSALGLVKADAKTENETSEVKIDSNGKLWSAGGVLKEALVPNTSVGGIKAGTDTFAAGTTIESILRKLLVLPTYTVTFEAGEGSGTQEGSPMSVVSGGSCTLPTCTFTKPEGKVFDCWYVGSERKAVGDSFTVSADTTVTALWKSATLTVYYDTVDDEAESLYPTSVNEMTADSTQTAAEIKANGYTRTYDTTIYEFGGHPRFAYPTELGLLSKVSCHDQEETDIDAVFEHQTIGGCYVYVLIDSSMDNEDKYQFLWA